MFVSPSTRKHSTPINTPEVDPSHRKLTVSSIFHTRALLSQLGLPSELIDIILDAAEYWASIVSHRYDEVRVKAEDAISASLEEVTPPHAEEKYLTSAPVPVIAESSVDGHVGYQCYTAAKVRKVVFRLRSCDQGRSNHAQCRGTYKSTSSWFSVGIEPPSRPQATNEVDEDTSNIGTPSELQLRLEFANDEKHPKVARQIPDVDEEEEKERRWFLQYNVHGSRHRFMHEIVWTCGSVSYDGENELQSRLPRVDDQTLNDTNTTDPHGEEDDVASPSLPLLPELDEHTGRGYGRDFLEHLVGGASISIYACAQYAGWENHVYAAEIEMFCFV